MDRAELECRNKALFDLRLSLQQRASYIDRFNSVSRSCTTCNHRCRFLVLYLFKQERLPAIAPFTWPFSPL